MGTGDSTGTVVHYSTPPSKPHHIRTFKYSIHHEMKQCKAGSREELSVTVHENYRLNSYSGCSVIYGVHPARHRR